MVDGGEAVCFKAWGNLNIIVGKHILMVFVRQVVSASLLVFFLLVGTTVEARGDGRAELVLTYGESGLPRDNVFHVGEKVFATIRLSGLEDPPPYIGQIQVTGSVVDAQGKEVLRIDKQPENYWQVLGGDSIETTLVFDSLVPCSRPRGHGTYIQVCPSRQA